MPEPFDPATLGLPPGGEIHRLLAENPDIQARRYREGERLITEGEDSQEIFVLLDGGLVVEQAASGPHAQPTILSCLTAEPDSHPIVGEMAYLGTIRRTASVRSAGCSHVLCLQPAHIDRIIESCPGLTRVICTQFSRRLQEVLGSLRTLQGRFALSPRNRMAQDGDLLFAPGDPAPELIRLVAGNVTLEGPAGSRTVGPEDLPDGFLEPAAFLGGRPYPVRAVVSGMAFLSCLGAEDREAVVRTFPALVLAVLAEAL